jgi:hypothetical protein
MSLLEYACSLTTNSKNDSDYLYEGKLKKNKLFKLHQFFINIYNHRKNQQKKKSKNLL